jgi:hypothetical protein
MGYLIHGGSTVDDIAYSKLAVSYFECLVWERLYAPVGIVYCTVAAGFRTMDVHQYCASA